MIRHLLVAVLCLIAQPAMAAVSGLFTYTDNGADITITDYPDAATGAVTIPSSIAGKPVTDIGSYAFYGCANISSVTFPASVASIGEFAFGTCSALTAFNVSASNTSFSSAGGVLFTKDKTGLINYPCGKTGAYTIPSGVKNIGNNAFYGCHGLTSVTLPSSVKTIGSYAFYECITITSLAVPAGVVSIGNFAFGACSLLTSISVDAANAAFASAGGALYSKDKSILLQFPAGKTGTQIISGSVKTIAANAFYGCKGLTGVTLPSSVTTIGNQAFYYCESLTEVVIPQGVISIDSYAFGSCRMLASVTLPNSLSTIGSSAFYSCVKLTEVVIPAGVTIIGGGAFNYCSALKSIRVVDANPNYSDRFGVLYNKTKTTLIAYPSGRNGNYAIPNSVTTIARFAFANCTGLSDITIPSKVASLEEYAFYGCTSMTLATFLGNAPTMGISVFDFTASGFRTRFVSGKTGFTTPTWLGFPCSGVPARPEITIQQPTGTDLVDGTAQTNFGRITVGQNSSYRNYNIRNTGTANLTGLSYIIDGTNPSNYNATTLARTLNPGASTTLRVRFKPNAPTTRTAVLRIMSNDGDENPFDIRLTGSGRAP